MELKQQNTDNSLGFLFYFFVVPIAVTICAVIMLWQFIFN